MSEPNPNPELFTTFERLESCHRVEVTEDNIHEIAKHFGWSVSYSDDEPKIWKTGHYSVEIGAWVDQKGSRWNPEPLTQGWSPEGTFTTTQVNGGHSNTPTLRRSGTDREQS